MAKPYDKVKEEVDMFVKKMSPQANMMTGRGLNGMDQSNPAFTYHNTMYHHTAVSRSFNIENISHYLRVIMFGTSDIPTKDVLTSITLGTSAIQDQAPIRYQLNANILFDNFLSSFPSQEKLHKGRPHPLTF
jgi:hypothetical protein